MKNAARFYAGNLVPWGLEYHWRGCDGCVVMSSVKILSVKVTTQPGTRAQRALESPHPIRGYRPATMGGLMVGAGPSRADGRQTGRLTRRLNATGATFAGHFGPTCSVLVVVASRWVMPPFNLRPAETFHADTANLGLSWCLPPSAIGPVARVVRVAGSDLNHRFRGA